MIKRVLYVYFILWALTWSAALLTTNIFTDKYFYRFLCRWIVKVLISQLLPYTGPCILFTRVTYWDDSGWGWGGWGGVELGADVPPSTSPALSWPRNSTSSSFFFSYTPVCPNNNIAFWSVVRSHSGKSPLLAE